MIVFAIKSGISEQRIYLSNLIFHKGVYASGIGERPSARSKRQDKMSATIAGYREFCVKPRKYGGARLALAVQEVLTHMVRLESCRINACQLNSTDPFFLLSPKCFPEVFLHLEVAEALWNVSVGL